LIAAASYRDLQLSTDPPLIEKVRDIIGLYMQPPTHAVVLCVEEKLQVHSQA
jgi:hypothetical protein